jgi:hypothetical protein
MVIEAPEIVRSLVAPRWSAGKLSEIEPQSLDAQARLEGLFNVLGLLK